MLGTKICRIALKLHDLKTKKKKKIIIMEIVYDYSFCTSAVQ